MTVHNKAEASVKISRRTFTCCCGGCGFGGLSDAESFAEDRPLLFQCSALIFVLALVVATHISGLTYLAFGGLACAGIAGIGAFSAATYIRVSG
ncbi:hypothetical protein [Actinocrispum wychmicini]|uniref:Uncharacterized protein n=1 Tax=Actinocrispum wychmicini TaxID=1213861 RepID=A0A4R2JUX6_9PSEU|nr:hypothetical protein [Actinocrispum wychmicini]TCO57955.1 hypothetical protein EV192_10517 [Actinocrispum wychmicini]